MRENSSVLMNSTPRDSGRSWFYNRDWLPKDAILFRDFCDNMGACPGFEINTQENHQTKTNPAASSGADRLKCECANEKPSVRRGRLY